MMKRGKDFIVVQINKVQRIISKFISRITRRRDTERCSNEHQQPQYVSNDHVRQPQDDHIVMDPMSILGMDLIHRDDTTHFAIMLSR